MEEGGMGQKQKQIPVAIEGGVVRRRKPGADCR